MDMLDRGAPVATGGAHLWAVVLAGGRGSRLQPLTADANGLHVPKQFCSLRGGASLLHEALRRAAGLAPPERICAVVAAEHGRWWKPELAGLPAANVIVQPANRGTANGILLPVLEIARRDPLASVVILPSDHHAEDEATLALALRSAARLATRDPRHLFVLGIRPDEADSELGYVVPGEEDGEGACTVLRFVEKPDAALAAELLRAGALWNSFIIASRAQALLELFARRMPEVAAAMRGALERGRGSQPDDGPLADLYAGLREIDFSREVMRGAEPRLRVLAVPACGWSDLGTPRRLAAALGRSPRVAERAADDVPYAAVVNLAAQQARLVAAAP